VTGPGGGVPEALLAAHAHSAAGRYAAAVSLYEQALTLDLAPVPRRQALAGLGVAHRWLGDYADAVAILRAGVAEFPDFAPMRAFLAVALYSAGQADEAVSLLLHLYAEHAGEYRDAIARHADHLDDPLP